MLMGPLAHARKSMESRHPILVASFHPLAARTWLNIPLSVLRDRVVPLADVAPHLMGALAETFSAPSAEGLSLPTTMQLELKLHRRLTLAIASLRSGRSVGATAAALELSGRQFERIFEFELGLTPKLFARIVRFRRCISAAKAGTTLSAAASVAGYADQSHFNREMQAFMSGSPSIILPNVGNVQDILHGNMAD